MRGGQAGRARERQVADRLRSEDWVVVKGTTYGTCDLVALRGTTVDLVDPPYVLRTCRAMLIEVKSTVGGPYHSFGPEDRRKLAEEAVLAGADAVLAWWPPRGKLRLIFSHEWPVTA